MWAARKGHGTIVKLLLEQEGITPNTADNEGRTLLSWVAESGSGDIAKMLLERQDVAPDTADKNGRTPLLWATGNAHEDVVRMLLKREGVTPNTVADSSLCSPSISCHVCEFFYCTSIQTRYASSLLHD